VAAPSNICGYQTPYLMQSRMNRTELEKRVGVHGERMSVVVIAEVGEPLQEEAVARHVVALA